MNVNVMGFAAVAASVVAFGLTRKQAPGIRWLLLAAFGLPAIPALLFTAYYFRVLPEKECFYSLRSAAIAAA